MNGLPRGSPKNNGPAGRPALHIALALLGLAAAVAVAVGPWRGARQPAAGDNRQAEGKVSRDAPQTDPQAAARYKMVASQLRRRDIDDPRVLAAMEKVPRHRFVPERLVELAYADQPLAIGHGQTISQPYIVALMTQLVPTGPGKRALDVGTGSGYQAALLGELCDQVYSIEIVEPLANDAAARLANLGYDNVEVRAGDGYRGWPEHAPFDAIVVAAAPDHVPQPLVDQLAPGGRLVIPVGSYYQQLLVIEKEADGSVRERRVAAVAFVPMTGEAEDGDRRDD